MGKVTIGVKLIHNNIVLFCCLTKCLYSAVSNDDVIYDLKGLNQYGCYTLHQKYSTNT